MDKALRVLAFLANGLMVLGILFLWANERPRGGEALLFALLFLVPILSLLALWCGPDAEERRLRRQLNKAELKQRLKELGQS